MAVLSLEKYDADVLRGPMDKVEQIDDDIRSLVEDMEESMYAHSGVGLAAPQIGVGKQITVMDCGKKRDGSELVCMINPEIIETEGELEGEEGCLSLPGIWGDPHRHQYAKAKYLTPDGEEETIAREGLWARCIQHEVDHLKGTLFIDHLTGDEKQAAEKRLKTLSEWEKHPEKRIEAGTTWEEFSSGEDKFSTFNRQQFSNRSISSLPTDVFESLENDLHVVAITEIANFESGFVIPTVARVADAFERVHFHIFPIDEHPDVLDYYLTYGYTNCPLLVFFDDTYNEVGVWGPRPEGARNLIGELNEQNIPESNKHKRLQRYYEQKGVAEVLEEIASLLSDSSLETKT